MPGPTLPRYLTTALLLLLALGVLARPVLERLGAMHQAAHPAVTDAQHHHHEGAAEPDERPGHGGDSGTHGVLHEMCSSGAFCMLSQGLTMPGPIDRALAWPSRYARPVLLLRSGTPFRPPIA